MAARLTHLTRMRFRIAPLRKARRCSSHFVFSLATVLVVEPTFVVRTIFGGFSLA